jgi:hypothetical protein
VTGIRRCDKAEVAALYARVKAGRLKSVTNEPASGNLADLMIKTDWVDRSQFFMSLLTRLAIEHNCDRARVEEEIRKSEVGKSRCPERWPRLQQHEMDLAIRCAKEAIAKRSSRKSEIEEWELVVTDADKVTPRETVWLWPGWIERGVLFGSFGDSKEGKSPVWCDIAAILTAGRDFPDGTKNTHGPLNVILCNCEDDFERKTLPRFLAAGGDPTRLKHIDGVRPRNSSLRARVLALDESIGKVCEYLRQQKEKGVEFALTVFDPITSMLGRMKYTDHQQTRRVMDPLADLAREFNLAVGIVNHFNRNTETQAPQYRTLGGGLYQVCRSVLLHTRPKDVDLANENDRYRHVLSEDRNQEVDSIEYSTKKESFEHEGKKYEVIRIVWGKQLKDRSDAFMDQSSTQDRGLYARLAKEAEKYLRGRKNGELASSCVAYLETCFPELKGRKAFNWERVRDRAGIITGKDGKANRWCLESEKGTENLFEKTRSENDAPKY